MSRDYLNMRCEKPWLTALDDMAVKLRQGIAHVCRRRHRVSGRYG